MDLDQDHLNEIWKRLKDGTYNHPDSVIRGEIVESDEAGDAMSIPSANGEKRTVY
ncbi:MAG: hypothetical protein GKR94_09775 [Gammaproteobacteria bacterium]|nr:hypothetical protein [Gammaproteobacteria bacterium]